MIEAEEQRSYLCAGDRCIRTSIERFARCYDESDTVAMGSFAFFQPRTRPGLLWVMAVLRSQRTQQEWPPHVLRP